MIFLKENKNLKKIEKKIEKIFYLFILINIFINFVAASGSLLTGQINPQTINLCGNNAQYVTLTAYNLFNLENTTLVNVNAALYLHSTNNQNSGLTFITSQNVNLGNLNALSYSAINPSWTLQCNNPNSGLYTAYINYTSSNGYKASSLNEQTATIIVHDATAFTGNISLESSSQAIQEDYPIINDNTPTIKVFTTKNSICKGSLNIDKDYENMDFLFYGLEKEHNYTFINQLNQGKQIVYVKCKDEINNLMQLTLQFEIDSSEPIITLIQPEQKVLGDFTELIIQVNEISECRYNKNDLNFSEMKLFDTKNTTIYKVKLDNLEEKTYTYFVKCKDKIGNIAKKQIDFEVYTEPKAYIELEKTTLTKGTYEIKLIPNKKLKSASLYYSFTDEPEIKREIGLVKENDYFKGYLIIDEHEKTRQGLFTFKGIDLMDNEGSEIIEGSFFILDTIKPNAPETLTGKNTEQGILLKWYYDFEKPEKFIIYRGTTQGLSPIFFYDSQEAEKLNSNFENYYEYLDKNIEQGKLYYYRVSAVDIAGNIGLMSNEISVYSDKSLISNNQKEEIEINLPTQQTRDLKKSTEKNIDSLLIDLEWALTNLKEKSTKEKVVEDLNLIKKALDAKTNIESQKNYLKNIDLNQISDTELRNKISEIEALIARTKKLTPKNIEIEKKTTQIQSLNKNDIESIIKEIFSQQNYTESQIKKYLKEIQKINENLKVELEIISINLNYLDDSNEKQVLVKKIFSYEKPEPVNDIIIIEMIPKTVAGDISSIDIKTPDYSIINPDPMISWKFSEISYDKKQYYYVLLSNDNSESAKTTKTIAIIDPIKIINNQETILTGFSIFINNISSNPEYIGLLIGSFIIIVLLTYYVFSTYEVKNFNFIKDTYNNINNQLKSKFSFEKNIKNTNENTNENTKITNEKILNDNIKNIIDKIKKETNNIDNKNIEDNNIYTNRLKEEINDLKDLNKSNIKNEQIIAELKNLILIENIAKIKPENYFYAKNGEVIRGLKELKTALEK
ncbi:MAG: hypothetical protein QXM96_03295, partial [Candidatus Woesearchaeota archaeon]